MKKETLRHKAAFEFYYMLGEKRSYQQVATKFTVSHTSIKKWALAFNWQERVVIRDAENAKRLEKATDNNVVKRKANLLKVADVLLAQYVDKLRSKEIDLKSVQDYERIGRMTLLLTGEPTEINENKSDANDSEILRRLVAIVESESSNGNGELTDELKQRIQEDVSK